MRPTPRHRITRRGICLCCVSATLAAAGGTLTPQQAFAEAQGIVDRIRSAAAAAPITIHRLRGGVAVLEGSGGNVAVFAGRDGKVMVDAGIEVSRRQMAAALDELGPAPLTHLVNTHWHFDHASGNQWLCELRPTIVAHENTLKHLRATQRVEDWDHDFAPLPAAALPNEVFAAERALAVSGATLQLSWYGPAHTDSDIAVRFTEADILHAADTYWNRAYPFIDRSTGGSIDGSIRAAEANLAAATDATVVIPGHGDPVSDRAGLLAFRDMLVAIRGRIATLKRQGRSLAETIAAKPTADFDAEWGGFVISPALFTRTVYLDV